MSERTVILTLRLPADLHERVKRLAALDERSLNAELLRCIRVGATTLEEPLAG